MGTLKNKSWVKIALADAMEDYRAKPTSFNLSRLTRLALLHGGYPIPDSTKEQNDKHYGRTTQL